LLVILALGPPAKLNLFAKKASTEPLPGWQKAKSAERAVKADDYLLAESEYRFALGESLNAVGNIAMSEHRWDEAVRAFEEATYALADPTISSLNLASVFLQQKKPKQAEAVLRDVLSGSQRSNPRLRQMLAAAYAGQGRFPEALQEMNDARSLDPDDPELLYAHAMIALRAGKFEEAKPLMAQLEKLRPGPAVHVLLGRTLRDFQQFDQAQSQLKRALQLDPKTPRAEYYLGTLILLRNQFEKMDEAIAHFCSELENYPNDYLANLHLGIAYVSTRRAAEALPFLEKAAAVSRESEPLYHLGQARFQTNDLSGAIDALQRYLQPTADTAAAKSGPNVSSAHYVLAQALRAKGREMEALEHFEQARALKQDFAQTSQERMRSYLAEQAAETVGSGNFQVAVSPLSASPELERVKQQLSALIAESYFNLGVVLAKKERFKSSATLFYRASQWDPDYPNVDFSLGLARFKAAQYGLAVPALEKALAKAPTQADVVRMLGLSYFHSEQYARAAQILGRDPDIKTDPELQYTLGLSLIRSGAADRAAEIFRYMLSRNARSADVHLLLGDAHADQKQFDEALSEYKYALEIDPRLASAHLSTALILLRRGQLPQAQRELETELKNHPGDQRARYHLAYVLDLQGQRDQASTMLREVLRSGPAIPDARYLFGKILFARGESTAAAEQLEAAVRLAPTESRFRYQLALTLQKLGRSTEAESQFEKFRELKAKEQPSDKP
jgi:tetratricopeptide (TPR) repeat protein